MVAAPVHAATADTAGAYPNRPVRLIMGPGAGGPTDSVGRVLATRLTELWGHPVIVENRPGAGNTIATAAAAKATPDGYTLLLCPISDAVAPSLYKKLPYNFEKEIVAISHIGVTPNVFVVPPSQPVKSVKDFIAHAKANPGKLNYGGLGVGQSGHLAMELLKHMTGIDVVYVPYKTAGLAVTDLLAGRMDAQITNLPVHVDNIRAGKVRALGVTSAKRSPRFPEIPAITEEHRERQRTHNRWILRELEAIPLAGLTPSEKLTHELLAYRSREGLEWLSLPFHRHYIFIQLDGGVATNLIKLIERQPLRNEADYRAWFTRVSRFPQYLDGVARVMREGMETGLTIPARSWSAHWRSSIRSPQARNRWKRARCGSR